MVSQKEQHQGDAGGVGGKQPVQPLLPPPGGGPELGDGGRADGLGGLHQSGHHPLAPGAATQALPLQIGAGLLDRPPQGGVRPGVPLQSGGKPVQKGPVPLQQAQGRPAGGEAAPQAGLQQGPKGGHGKLHRGRVAHRNRGRRLRGGDHPLYRRHQRLQPFPPAGGGAHHGHPQTAGQPLQLHPHTLALRLVQEVDAHHGAGLELQGLEYQIQVALQAGGVAHHHRPVRAAEAKEVPGHLLLGGVGHEGVGAGEVHQHIAPAAPLTAALGAGHCLARPVAGVLAQAGKGVEHGGLAHVGIARQGHDAVIGPLTPEHQGGVRRPGAGGGAGQSHRASPRYTPPASRPRRAMTAPRIR